jgi:microcin C transport system substrate-binding protein
MQSPSLPGAPFNRGSDRRRHRNRRAAPSVDLQSRRALGDSLRRSEDCKSQRLRELNVLITRRVFFPIAGVALLNPIAIGFEGQAAAATRPRRQVWRHGLSLFGDLKYPAGFPHFDYVNANAPKGGAVRQAAFGTYDNFNMVVAGWKGKLAAGLDLTYETLLMPSLDEASAAYGLLAEAVTHPTDFSSVTYRLRAQAKWHDGQPVTPDDVIFSFEAVPDNGAP